MVPHELDLRSSATGSEGFLLAAEPALPFAQVDSGLVVVVLSRHVVDALAAGADVALDRTHGGAHLAQDADTDGEGCDGDGDWHNPPGRRFDRLRFESARINRDDDAGFGLCNGHALSAF